MFFCIVSQTLKFVIRAGWVKRSFYLPPLKAEKEKKKKGNNEERERKRE